MAGARFTIPQLPSTIGGSFFDYKYQGQPGLPTQRTSAGLDLGATYGLGPGAVLVAEYLWGYNYQGGYNFLTNAGHCDCNQPGELEQQGSGANPGGGYRTALLRQRGVPPS